MNRVTLLQGHVLDKLRELPENSVHCVVTSPPYWGLRDYGIEGQVWGGESSCSHLFTENIPPRGKSGWHTFEKKYHSPGCHQTTIGSKAKKEPEVNPGHGSFCRLCSAWRGSYGLEPTIELYIQHTVEIFREVRRVLRKDGVCFLNLGDSYAHSQPGRNRNGTGGQIVRPYGTTDRVQKGNPDLCHGLKNKDLCGIPWRVALALQADGWWLRSDIIWAKPNPMPESVTDRPTRSHEYIFLLTKSAKYFWDKEGVSEELTRPEEADRKTPARFGGADKFVETKKQSRLHSGNEYRGTPNGTRNLRSVWTIATAPFPEAHFATFPPALVEKCIKAGTSEKGVCPKCGAPWVRVVKKEYVGTHDGHKHKYKNKGKHSGYVCTNDEVLNIKTQTLYWKPSCICPIPELTSPADFLKSATVLDPFSGSGTTCLVAAKLGRDSIGIELKPEYVEMAKKRIKREMGFLVQVTTDVTTEDPEVERLGGLEPPHFGLEVGCPKTGESED